MDVKPLECMWGFNCIGTNINVMIDHSVAGVNAVYNLHADALDHYMHDMTSVLLLPLYSTVKLYLMSLLKVDLN